jgi:hypothetical protein
VASKNDLIGVEEDKIKSILIFNKTTRLSLIRLIWPSSFTDIQRFFHFKNCDEKSVECLLNGKSVQFISYLQIVSINFKKWSHYQLVVATLSHVYDFTLLSGTRKPYLIWKNQWSFQFLSMKRNFHLNTSSAASITCLCKTFVKKWYLWKYCQRLVLSFFDYCFNARSGFVC